MKLSDLAHELGVSTATISNALNGKGRMTAQLRQQICKSAKALGYVHTPRISSKARELMVISEANEVSFSCEMASGITHAAWQKNAACALYDLGILQAGLGREATPAQLRPLVEQCIRQHPLPPSCIIYISQYPRSLPGLLEGLSCPSVEVYCYDSGAKVSVNYDDQQGAYQAVSHLIESGRHTIAMISGPVTSHSASERMVGYQRALIAHGLPFHPKYVWIGEWDAATGRSLTHDLLNLDDRPDAIFAQSDTLACGALLAVHQAGLRVPEDIAIVSFDNTVLAQHAFPALTSVDPPFREMGKAAFAQADRLIEGIPPIASEIRIPCSLRVRESSSLFRPQPTMANEPCAKDE